MPVFKKPPAAVLLDRRHNLHAAIDQGGLAWPDAIKAMRSAMGMTQAEFARTFHLTVRQVIAYENGRANPTVETLNRLGKVFGLEAGFIRKASASTGNARRVEK